MTTIRFPRRLPSTAHHNAEQNQTTPPPFTYEPLTHPEKGQTEYHFRLLYVLPGSPTDPICCEIRSHYADGFPPYEALSYYWGNAGNRASILLNKRLFNVTANVAQALSHLRHTDKTRLLWIDQICIDQRNLRERSYQVSIMRLIYSRAIRAVVWLGVGNEKTKIAFESVPRLARIRAELQASGVVYSRVPHVDDFLARYGLPSRVSLDEGLHALTMMLEQPFFERVWVIQEVVVSQTATIVQGRLEIFWGDFAAAVLLIWELRMDLFTSDTVGRNLKNVNFIEVARVLRQNGKRGRLRLSLGLFRTSKATDPRDKIYALVGLSDAAQAGSAAMLSYERSVSDAYRLWTIYMLRNENSLEILSAVNRYESSGNTIIYSWVPDWNVTDENTTHHVDAWLSARFQACASAEMEISFQDDERIMGLIGHSLDRVEAVGLPYHASAKATLFGFVALAQAYAVHRIWRSWEAVAQVGQRQKYVATGEDMWDAYWQTILFGEPGPDEGQKARVRAEFNAFFAFNRQPYLTGERWKVYWIKHIWAIFYLVTTILTSLAVHGIKSKRSPGLAFSSRFDQTGWRRMIRTQRAGYIGLAVYAAEVGDHIALFKGGRMPLLVRPVSDGWMLVGDCYVHGAMQGELWQVDKCQTFWIH